MAVSNETYARGTVSKVKGREERARLNRERNVRTDKITIRFNKNQIMIEKTRISN